MHFIAIDVETANADMSSICQIGIVIFKNGKIVKEWESLVNPKQSFDEINIGIHGITEQMVKNSPTIEELYHELFSMLNQKTLVSHMSFDRVALDRAFRKNNLEILNSSWIDSAKVVRRTWEEFSKKGYGLKKVAKKLKISFNHHDALEDARTCGKILLKALEHSNMTLDEIKIKTKKPINLNNYQKEVVGNPNGALAGEVLVFTGELSITRKEATTIATNAGCTVTPNMKKSVTILVIGDQDTKKLKGKDKSSKQRKAEELMAKGQEIKIIGESDFIEMIKHT